MYHVIVLASQKMAHNLTILTDLSCTKQYVQPEKKYALLPASRLR